MPHKYNFNEYRQIKAMNGSTLVKGLKSMKHLKHALYDEQDSPTDAMKAGSVAHALLLEPEEFEQIYVVQPDFKNDPKNVDSKDNRSHSANTKWCQRHVADFKAGVEINGQTVVDQGLMRKCHAMRRAVEANECAAMWMSQSAREQTLLGTIEGVPCKGRVDLMSGLAILDVKTSQSADQYAFGRTCANLNYVFKMAIYQELARLETGHAPDMYFIVVESDSPFDVAVYGIPDEALAQGLRDVKKVLNDYTKAKESGVWNGTNRGVDPNPLFIPNWAMDDEDTGLEWSEVSP